MSTQIISLVAATRIVRVWVNPRRPWDDAVKAGGPDTRNTSDIRKVGNAYPPKKGVPKKGIPSEQRSIIITNFGQILRVQDAIDAAVKMGLKPEMPRSIFAIGEYLPQLHVGLRVNGIRLISPIPCNVEHGQYVPLVWWDGPKRSADLHPLEKPLDTSFWFAFSF